MSDDLKTFLVKIPENKAAFIRADTAKIKDGILTFYSIYDSSIVAAFIEGSWTSFSETNQ